MKNRREFCQSMLGTAIGAAALTTQPTLIAEIQKCRVTAKGGRPLLELQQRFIDLRFGMFVHFNMATFQDREWGDPTSPAELSIHQPGHGPMGGRGPNREHDLGLSDDQTPTMDFAFGRQPPKVQV